MKQIGYGSCDTLQSGSNPRNKMIEMEQILSARASNTSLDASDTLLPKFCSGMASASKQVHAEVLCSWLHKLSLNLHITLYCALF